MEKEPLRVGQLFADKNPDRVGRHYRVIEIVLKGVHGVREDTAVCVCRGKVTPVAIRRLLHESRFERIVEKSEHMVTTKALPASVDDFV